MPQQPVVRVLTGMGGVGKTSIARAYAAGHHRRYTLVWWINAQLADTIPEQFRRLFGVLAPDEATKVPDPVATMHAVLANRSGRWLLVLDNVPNPAAAHGLIPAAGPGDVVITSQARVWPGQSTIPVGCLNTEQGAAVLSQLSGDPNGETAAALSTELGGLPLALALAGNYVATHPGTTLADYQRLYTRYHLRLHQDKELPDYERTVATTWQMAFDTLDPPARALLNVLCWCAPETIPLHLMLAAAPPDPLLEPVDLLLNDELARNQAISALNAVSLVTPASPAGSVSIHRLVQSFTRDQPEADHGAWARIAALLITKALPETPATLAKLERWSLLHPHLGTVLRHLPSDDATALRARSSLATWTGEAGDRARARDLFAGLVPEFTAALGAHDRATLVARSDLADWTGHAGDVIRAVDLHTELRPDISAALGADDRDTLVVRSNFAFWIGQAGDAARARDMYADLVPDMVAALGANCRETLAVRSNVANWTATAGDVARARDLLAEIVPDMIAALGPDHPETLFVRGNLANRTGEAGDLAQARDLCAELVPDFTRVLGAEHRETLTVRGSLAILTGQAGDAVRARDLLAELIPDLARVFGADHRETLEARRNLDYWTNEAG